MRRRTHLVALCVVVAMLSLVACGEKKAEEAKTIRIGIAGPMQFIQGEHHWNGASLAAKEINKTGVKVGEETYKIKVVKIDTNEIQNASDAATAVEQAITGKKVDFLMGGFRTEAVTPMTEIAADNKMIFMIAGSATDELLKGRVDTDYARWKYLFRVTPVRSTDLAKLSVILLTDVVAGVRKEFGVAKPKVAILAEQLTWNEKLITSVQQIVQAAPPKGLGCELVGTWRPSATATDVTAELNAIAAKGAHVIYTANSGPVGVPAGRDYGRLKIPAAMVGITVEAQDSEWPTKTGGMGDYVATLQTYAPVKITDKTIPFYNAYMKEYGKPPAYTAGTYEGIYIFKDAIERAGKLDSDSVVKALETTDYAGAAGRIKFDALHDITWGPGLVTALGIQWQEGKMQTFWPLQWKPDAVNKPDLVVGYEGVVPFKFPTWMVEALKK